VPAPHRQGDSVVKVRRVVEVLEKIAPPELAAEWDNVGLLVGDPNADVERMMLCVDLTTPVLAEAVRSRAQMVLAYHPVIFKPVARVTAGAAPPVYEAIRAGLAVYCPHTALDAAPGGTNDVLAECVGLTDARPLKDVAGQQRCKIVVFAPPEAFEAISEAAFAVGAGRIGNYTHCSFRSDGAGTFQGGTGSRPATGQAGRLEQVQEMRVEVIAPRSSLPAVVTAVRAAHPYEEPPIDVYPLEPEPAGAGMGRIGELARPVQASTLIERVKKATGVKHPLVAAPDGRTVLRAKVRKAACCVGSCGSLFRAAARRGATFYLTGEMRHHDALAATAAGMTVVCLGHSNSERIALPRLAERIREALPGLHVARSRADRDPFQAA